MRFCWDEDKNRILKENKKRGSLGFEKVLQMFQLPHYQAIRNDDPEQFISIGWVDGCLYSLIYEERDDEYGPYRHLITFWKSTKEEQKIYAKHT